MEDNKLPMKSTPITKESVKAKATSELTRLNYQNMLKDLVAIRVGPENLKASQETMQAAKKIEKAIDELRVQEKRPFDNDANTVQESFLEFLTPLRNEIKRVATDVGTVNAAQLAEKKLKDDENARLLSVRAAIQTFFNESVLQISDARTDNEIVSVQKRMGTEKSRKGFYKDLMPELESACEKLAPKINERKEDIRKMAILQQKSEEALKSGDIQAATDVKEAAEILDHKMEEDVLRLQDAAYEATTSIEVPLVEVTTQTVKGRRLWRWKVEDIKMLAKKRPELVILQPNAEAIDALLTEKRKDGSLDEVDEVKIDGLIFYIKPSY